MLFAFFFLFYSLQHEEQITHTYFGVQRPEWRFSQNHFLKSLYYAPQESRASPCVKCHSFVCYLKILQQPRDTEKICHTLLF